MDRPWHVAASALITLFDPALAGDRYNTNPRISSISPKIIRKK